MARHVDHATCDRRPNRQATTSLDARCRTNRLADRSMSACVLLQQGRGLEWRPYEEFHNKNMGDPASATKAAIEWWMERSSAPSDEDINLYQKAPTVRRLLSREKILSLNEADLEELSSSTH